MLACTLNRIYGCAREIAGCIAHDTHICTRTTLMFRPALPKSPWTRALGVVKLILGDTSHAGNVVDGARYGAWFYDHFHGEDLVQCGRSFRRSVSLSHTFKKASISARKHGLLHGRMTTTHHSGKQVLISDFAYGNVHGFNKASKSYNVSRGGALGKETTGLHWRSNIVACDFVKLA